MTLGEEAAAGRKCAALCITRQAQSGWQYRGKACKRSRQHVQQAVLTSPGLMSPRRTASSSASGMDAALVLPYCDRLLTTRSAAQHSVAQHNSTNARHPTHALAGIEAHIAGRAVHGIGVQKVKHEAAAGGGQVGNRGNEVGHRRLRRFGKKGRNACKDDRWQVCCRQAC